MLPDLTDDELCAAFDSARLPKERFHHREHLRVAFLYLSRHGEAAVPSFCAALQRFATANGVPGKYRRDLTRDDLDRIERLMRGARHSTSGEFLRDNPGLLDSMPRPAASARG
jgi:hypothetical protein